MNVTFYTFSKHINSTAQPSGGTDISCVLKERTSITAPEISLNWNGSGNPTAYNYAYIGAFRRYYWVNNWTFNDRQWSARLAVDPLASYKTEIGSSVKYILRAADSTAWSGSLEVLDTAYPATAEKRYLRKAATWPNWSQYGGNYILGVVGAGNTLSFGGVGLYQATGAETHAIISNTYNAIDGIINSKPTGIAFDGAWIDWLGEVIIRCTGKVSDFITSLMYFPLSFWTYESVNVYLGLVQSGGTARKLADPIVHLSQSLSLADSSAPVGASYNVPPYKSIWLVVPPFGSFELDPADIRGSSTLYFDMTVDALSGGGILYVSVDNPDVAGEKIIIAVRTAQVGVQVPIAGNNIAPLSVATGAMSAISALASDNYVGALAGIGSMANATQGASKNSGGSGGIAALSGDIILYYRYLDPTDIDLQDHGEPVCKRMTINTLSGFIMCRDGEISAPATSEELAAISSYLTGGFFYE